MQNTLYPTTQTMRNIPIFKRPQWLSGPLNPQLFCLFLVLFTSTQIDAQSSAQIIGKLKEASNIAVEYASISLLQRDTTFVSSTISSASGEFTIYDVAPGIYFLRVDHIEYATYTTPPFIVKKNETKIIPDIILNSSVNSLDEVLITKKTPLIEVKADRLIFNVASSPSASGTNGLDLLKKSPGVTLDIDNSISIMGKGNVRVYLNGVESRLSGNDLTTFLQSLTSDIIQSIEIISNPSAKYDAEGTGGIINIRLKKNISTGFNGSATSSFSKGLEYKYSNNLSLNFGTEKVKTNIDVTQSQNNDYEGFIDEKQQNNSLLFLDSDENKIRKGFNTGIGIDYQLADNHFLNLNARGIFNKTDNSLNSRTDIYRVNPLEFLEILSSQSFLKGRSQNYIFNLNHFWNSGETSTLTTNISAGFYDTTNNTFQPNTRFEQDGTTVIASDNSTFDADTNINLWSGKVDFEKEWNAISLSAGIKYSHIITDNGFSFFNIENNQPILDITKSNDFEYTESVSAIYTNINLKLNEAISFNAGLRVENTDSRGKLTSDIPLDNKDVPRNYTDFFPNFSAIYDPQKNHIWGINIGRRITRPNYQDLNPFETPTSQLVIWKGNPFLKPNYIMNYQLSYTYKQKLVITTNYSKTTDFFAKILEVTGEDGTQIIPRNMEKSINYGLSISYPFSITDFWEVISFGNISRQSFEGDLEGTVIDLQNTLWNFQIQNILNLPLDILMDITYSQRSNWIWRGSVDIEGTKGLSFGIRKSFLDEKLQLRITGSDILRTETDYPYDSNYGGIDLEGVYISDGRRYGLGVTYKFGNQQARSKRKINGALDEELNRIEN